MTTLRHAAPVLDAGWQRVAVKYGDPVEVGAEDARRNQPTDARPDHDGVLTLVPTRRRN
jgi:hypothetical protein